MNADSTTDTTRKDSHAEATPPLNAAVPLLAIAGIVGLVLLFATTPTAPPPAMTVVPGAAAPQAGADPLPSWNEGDTKRAILTFLDDVTRKGASTFVPVPERVAVFDHDGTLVCEKPIVHGAFLIDRVRAFVDAHPDLAHEEPYATLLGGDIEFIRKLGKKFFADLTFATLAGMSEEELEDEVRAFLESARHPVFDVPYGEVTFQPMKELIALLRSRGFTVWICSGSGIHFMRPAAEAWYGIGPEHVIASRSTTEMRELDATGEALPAQASPNRRLALVVKPELEVLNDEERKPVSIGEQIGRRPIFAAGNVGTAGDIAMLRWSQSSPRPNLQLLVLHDDATREMAYGEPSNASLEAAERYGWHMVRMAADWKKIFAKPLVRKQAPPAQAPAVPAAAPADVTADADKPATPAATDNPQPDRWEEEIAAYESSDRNQPPAPGGVCLLGSSNIRLWKTLAEDLPGMNAANRGVGGAKLTELADFAPRLVAAAKPRVIVVSAGTNDVAGGASAAEVRDAFARLVENIRPHHPDATIAFLAIAPSIKRWDQLDRQCAANDAIRGLIESGAVGANVRYFDANAAFLGPDGKPAPECFIDDLQHPSTIGYARRAEILRPLLEQLLADAPAN